MEKSMNMDESCSQPKNNSADSVISSKDVEIGTKDYFALSLSIAHTQEAVASLFASNLVPISTFESNDSENHKDTQKRDECEQQQISNPSTKAFTAGEQDECRQEPEDVVVSTRISNRTCPKTNGKILDPKWYHNISSQTSDSSQSTTISSNSVTTSAFKKISSASESSKSPEILKRKRTARTKNPSGKVDTSIDLTSKDVGKSKKTSKLSPDSRVPIMFSKKIISGILRNKELSNHYVKTCSTTEEDSSGDHPIMFNRKIIACILRGKELRNDNPPKVKRTKKR